MKYLMECRRTFVALCGLIAIVICTHWNHSEVASSIAMICAAVAGANSAQEIFKNKN